MLRDALAAFQPQEIGDLVRRMPRLELLAEPEGKPTYIIRGLKSLSIRA